MVEKVIVSPESVRAYGNIVNMKTGDDFTLVNSELTVTTDTVDGVEMTVFVFEVEGGISISLVSSASTCNVGDNVLLTATVIDNNTPVEAAEVTFKLGDTVLGTDETDANGVATYTYTTSTAGSFSFTASYQTSTSNSVSVSVNHSYSLAFSQATYTASGGSATLECTLLEDNVAKSGASVTVTGSDGSVYNGITNSQGIASVTVSNISTATTFTASYSNVSDTCTVTVQTYLFYDACDSASGLSQYGSTYNFEGSNISATLTYDSSMNSYKATVDGHSPVLIPISVIDTMDNVKITADLYLTTVNSTTAIGVGIKGNRAGTSYSIINEKQSAVTRQRYSNQSWKSNDQINATTNIANKWVTMEVTVSGTVTTVTVYKDNTTVVSKTTYDLTSYESTRFNDLQYRQYGIVVGWDANHYSYVKNILVEPI